MRVGTVMESGGGVYLVALDDDREIEASLRGRLKQEERTGDRVVIGDRVEVEEAADGDFTIEAVRPRSTEVVRRAPGGRRAKVVAANLDRLVAVIAAASPDPSVDVIDRLLVIAESNGLDPYLVINKIDVDDGRSRAVELQRDYEAVGYRVLLTSAASGEGLEELATILCSGSSALVGPSGVGKSSLLNGLQPGLGLRIGELSRKHQRGRHTTVSSRLIDLECGGRVADTPGFSDVGLWGVDPEELDGFFPEFRDAVESCRFRGCAHSKEPDCGVKEAVERGEISEARYRSYLKLFEEATEAAAPRWKR